MGHGQQTTNLDKLSKGTQDTSNTVTLELLTTIQGKESVSQNIQSLILPGSDSWPKLGLPSLFLNSQLKLPLSF